MLTKAVTRGLWIALLVVIAAIVAILRSTPASTLRQAAFVALVAAPILGLLVAVVDYLRRRRRSQRASRPRPVAAHAYAAPRPVVRAHAAASRVVPPPVRRASPKQLSARPRPAM